MKIDRRLFKNILLELIDENPMACRGVLSILRIEYTDQVATLAVSLEDPPRLLVNLGFLEAEASEEVHVKAVLLHEFLHVLLNHTENFKEMDDATNVALDAVINHIIQRSEGEVYSAFFRQYYRNLTGYQSLLRPALETELYGYQDELTPLRRGLRQGTVVVDDILELAREIRKSAGGKQAGLSEHKQFLGHHGKRVGGKAVSGKVREALDNTLKSYNGSGIYREPKSRGFGADPFPERIAGKDENLVRWERATSKILRELCSPDPRGLRKEPVDRTVMMPVLNERDRRGFLKALWTPLILDMAWDIPYEKPQGTTVVYLDVSGSMYGEMQALVHLLGRLSHHIRKPFWAFSTEVAPAVIRKGILETRTTGGTSMNVVLRHFADMDVEKAVVITDGYIETCDPFLLARLSNKKFYAVVSRDGSSAKLAEAGIPYYQLERYPGGGPS